MFLYMEKKKKKAPKKATSAAGQSFIKADDIVARRNQDGTAILMHLDETSLFYKIEGFAALIWTELEKTRTVDGLIEHFSTLYPTHKKEIKTKIPAFFEKLLEFRLIIQSKEKAEKSYVTVKVPKSSDFRFGGIKSFDLEEIESEVLNESIYLDVFAGSDLRLKKKIKPLKDALTKVTQLTGVNYEWKPRKGAHKIPKGAQSGLIAQQVAVLMPELVQMDEGSKILAVNYSKLTSYLVEAIKELNEKILVQEKRIRQLEGN